MMVRRRDAARRTQEFSIANADSKGERVVDFPGQFLAQVGALPSPDYS